MVVLHHAYVTCGESNVKVFCMYTCTLYMQGCVYLKMDSLKSAMGAYNALHGGWYKG